jgi:hypothetical protein
MLSLDLSSLIELVLSNLPHELKPYLLIVATSLVWSLHFVLRHVINRIEAKTE